jgi:dienelactone hydrolase
VIVMTEMPGISPHVARFARWVRDAGFTVYMPSLFGRDGAVPGAEEGAAVFQRACISAEFRAMAANQSSPVTQWLRALARLAHQECGGPGVGAIGMCFTGNFALTMMLEPSLLAPVLSQPALPLNDPAGLEIAPEDIKAVREVLHCFSRAARTVAEMSTRSTRFGTLGPHRNSLCAPHASVLSFSPRLALALDRNAHPRDPWFYQSPRPALR